ncbi:hypothetical protein [Polaribacter sp. IC073]|uniref:hypothetical protein n=1 Tax=Polaribacter sp. IC073 TaxID=2508540 RepID=UPI0011BEE484|nr:hypothetical protein [Polaribacter sp. IC073]TXD45875.1 hypothetical protein ES045_15740 [Polaribacter sp. IC073]
MAELKTKIDNIKNLWKQINNKTAFIIECSSAVDRSANTLHNHWFARFWQVPNEKQDEVIIYMQKWIFNQK